MVKAQSWSRPELLADGFSRFMPRAVDNLNKILESTHASILLITSHRNTYSDDKWLNIFDNRDVHVSSISKLNTSYNTLNPLSRADEILSWYKSSSHNESFVIIDDDSSLNSLPPHLKDKCVITKPLIGLDAVSADKAISILTNQPHLHNA
jgi:hypothetical protein